MLERGTSSTSLESLVHTNSVLAKVDEVTTMEYLRSRFRLKYRARRLKNKGALLVIVWSFFVITLFQFTWEKVLKLFHNYMAIAIVAVIGLMLPIAGCMFWEVQSDMLEYHDNVDKLYATGIELCSFKTDWF